MPESTSTPDYIWIITHEETAKGARSSTSKEGSSFDIDEETPENGETEKNFVEVAKLTVEMKGFLQAMRKMLDEADPPGSTIQLDEVELSVEINAEGQVGLLGTGGKVGGKGAMTFKFKRKDG